MTSLSPSRTPLRHLPALDGLRGIALLGVLFFHANGALAGGYLGVDLFFVLSGYLITSLLLSEQRATGRIALSSFWIRRARRLFPALLSLMPAVALYGYFLAKPDDLRSLREGAIATLAYVANWEAILSKRSYWSLFAAPSPLEHMWSLAIEEQFYVVWPLVVALVLRRFGSRAILALSVALGLASAAAMYVLYDPGAVSRAYLGTDTRAAAILAGAALAAVLPPGTDLSPRAVRLLDGLGIVAFGGLAAAWIGLSGESSFLYRGGFWLTEIGVLVLIACAVMGERSVVARVLAFTPLTLVGTISYGLYLWHWPVNVVLTEARVHLHGVPLHALRFAITFAIAIASYRFLERPIRMRGVPFGRPMFIVPTAVVLCVLLVLQATHARPAVASEVVIGAPHPAEMPAPVRFQIMLLGDSTANSLGWGLRGVQRPGVAVELLGQDGCTMLADMCEAASWGKRAKEIRPNATIVFLGGAFLHGLSVDRTWRKACHVGWDSVFERTMTKRLGELVAEDAHVWLVTVPYPLGDWETSAIHGEVDCINRSLLHAAAQVPGVSVLDLAEHLCPQGECTRERDGVTIRPDGLHYSVDGAAEISRWVLDRIEP